MKACVYGAGAVGGNLAVRLMAAGGAAVSLIARGAHLGAIREHGLQLTSGTQQWVGHPLLATDNPAEVAPQDIVFVTLKAPALHLAAPHIAGMLKPEGFAVFITNGIPWWWNEGLDMQGAPASLLDPEGVLRQSLGARRSLGCVVNSSNEVNHPGQVTHLGNNRWVIGEADNSASNRLSETVALLNAAGLKAEPTTDIRMHVWTKLLKNASLNPLCALTRLSVQELAMHSDLRTMHRKILDELVEVAGAMGWDLKGPAADEARLMEADGAYRKPGAPRIKPSMLQDVLAHRPMEIDAILGEPLAFARRYAVETPALDMLTALVRGLQAASAAEEKT
jgi:2-dehydropantoate 2-reductase